eukprot:m.44019 g.44019  ORF g.44019 m.44019 type:complete len:112 (-) comp19550_c0_seq1:46-381(-)
MYNRVAMASEVHAQALTTGLQQVEFPHTLTFDIPFPSEYEATVAHRTLAVDQEPSGNTLKQLTVTASTLTLKLQSKQLKNLRVAVGSFFDMLLLTCETIQQFAPKSATVVV